MKPLYTIGIDIGGTKISGCLTNEKNEIVNSDIRPTPKENSLEVIHAVKTLIYEFLQKLSLDSLSGIGISTGGDVNHIRGEILSATDSIPKWKGTQLGYILRKEFNVPVFMENDGLMAVYGEWKVGAAKNFNYVVGLTVGTGLGGGIICEGRLLHGHNGAIANFWSLPVPEIIIEDKNIGERNIEYYLSGPGLIRIAKFINKTSNFETPKDIFDDLIQGESFAREVMDVFLKYLEFVLKVIKSTFLPEIIVIGGSVVTQNSDIMKREFNNIQTSFPFPILPSTLENKAGMLGAAIYARDNLNRLNIPQ